jgi:hypothetical protein
MERCGLRMQPNIHIHTFESVRECEGMSPHILSGLSFWELESFWSPKCLERNLKGQNSLDWKLIYTIEKLLRLRCLKWACMIHLSIYNTSYGRKKGQKSKCQFDLWPLKIKNYFELHVCRWFATYRWKAFDEGYNVSTNLASVKGFHKKLWASKVAGVPILRILGLLIWESHKKWHLGATLVASHIEYYKGENGGFPQVRAMVSLVSLCIYVVHPCTKNVPTIR